LSADTADTADDAVARTTPPDAASPIAARRKRHPGLLFARDLVVIAVVAILVSFLIKTFLVRPFYVPSQSMSHTLEIDDRIMVNELVPDVVPIARGDVVVFEDPGGWLDARPKAPKPPLAAAVGSFLVFVGLAASDSDSDLVKRVIGLPGDHVECCDVRGRMSIDGTPLDEPYISLPGGETRASKTDFSVTVPDGALWVMGDNRDDSRDSRYQTETPSKGFVPIEDVIGRAFVVSWPVDRWAWLGDYPETFAGVSDQG